MYVSIIIRLIPSVDETVNYVICNVSCDQLPTPYLNQYTTNNNSCYVNAQLEVLLTTLAYCFAFGTVLVKVGRVYHIFNNPTEKKKVRNEGKVMFEQRLHQYMYNNIHLMC